MKPSRIISETLVALVLFLALSMTSPATTRYVDLNSASPTSPFTSWSTAATNIQEAIDAASTDDVIWVTNGVYAVGGKVKSGDLTNRIALDKPLTVQSVNGPTATTIRGAGATNGTAAVRCAWVTNGATLNGFTLTAGATRTGGDGTNLQSGGAVLCVSSNAIVRNCLMISNTASYAGGGACQGSLINCGILGNRAITIGGGTAYSSLVNCTVVSNLSSSWGVYLGKLTNCIVYFNASLNYSAGTLSYCCAAPLPPGVGNIASAPQLMADAIHLTSTSPCRGAGTNLTSVTDIDGQSWENPPSIGCDEWHPEPVLVTQPTTQFVFDPAGFTMNVAVAGQEPFTCWWLKDGNLIEQNSHYVSALTTNLVVSGVTPFDPGSYQVVVSNAYGMATSAVVKLPVHCVDAASAAPVPPYSTWVTAATNIQDAVNAALAGEIVLVTNGTYAMGGKVMSG